MHAATLTQSLSSQWHQLPQCINCSDQHPMGLPLATSSHGIADIEMHNACTTLAFVQLTFPTLRRQDTCDSRINIERR
jgi:hypothetical protein